MKLIFGFLLLISQLALADTFVKEFQGNDDVTTRPFKVHGGWVIQWESEGKSIGIFVHDSKGELLNIATTQYNPGKGETYQVKGGTYVLEIVGSGKWKIKILETN